MMSLGDVLFSFNREILKGWFKMTKIVNLSLAPKLGNSFRSKKEPKVFKEVNLSSLDEAAS